MWELDDYLLIYNPTEQESVQSMADETHQELNQAESNYRKLQFAGFVTADAISKVISSSTNHSFRESCHGYLQVSKQQSVKQVIQKMFLKSVCYQGLRRKERENGKGVNINETPNSFSTSPFKKDDDGYAQDCTCNHFKKRRPGKDVSEDSPCKGTTMEIEDSDYFSQSPKNFKDCIPFGERNINNKQSTSGTATSDIEEKCHNQQAKELKCVVALLRAGFMVEDCHEMDELWHKEVCNLSNW